MPTLDKDFQKPTVGFVRRIIRAAGWAVFLPALCLLWAGSAQATDFTFTAGTHSSFPDCPVYGYNIPGNGMYGTNGWSQSGSTWTCAYNSVSLVAGDRILPTSSITIVVNADITFGGNNTIGTASVLVNIKTNSNAALTMNGTGSSSIYGNLDVSGAIGLTNVALHGNIASSGAVTLTNTTVTGTITTSQSLNITGGSVSGSVSATGGITATGSVPFGSSISATGGSISLSGGSVVGNVTASNGLTATNSVVFGGNLTVTNSQGVTSLSGGSVAGNVNTANGIQATNTTFNGYVKATSGTVTLTGGSVVNGIVAPCCAVSTTNTNISGGINGASNTITITGGIISGPIDTQGGDGVHITNATMTSGSITVASGNIQISGSTIGSASSTVNVSSTNEIRITNSSTIYGNVTAASWQDPSTVVDPTSRVHGVCKSSTSSTQNPGDYSNRCDGGVVAPDHLLLVHSGAGVTCTASPVTVYACGGADSGGTCPANTTGVSGNVTAGGVSVPFSIAAGSSSTTVSVPVTTASTVTLGTNAGTTTCWNGSSSSCSHTFSDTGFIFTTAADAAAASIPTQIAGVAGGSYYLRAVKTNTATKACEAALAGANTVNMAYQCIDPTACYGQNMLSMNGGGGAATIARNNGGGTVSSYTSLAITFDANGNAPFTLNYADVGKIQLYASKAAGGSLLTTLTGASNSFVVKPYAFAFSNIKCTNASSGYCAAGALAQTPVGSNPAASDATGPSFIQAGNLFSATVTAQAYNSAGNTATPSYGNEAVAEGVQLSYALVAPSGGNVGSLTGTTAIVGNGKFTNGVATATDLAWSEVGIITLSTAVKDGDYLGAGNVTSVSGNVGRFIPDHFTTIVSQYQSACLASNNPGGTVAFTYSGQPLGLTVTALNRSGSATQNYTGSFAKAVTLSVLGSDGSTANPGPGALASTSVAAASFSSGVAGILPVTYTFGNKLTAPTTVRLRAVDTDGVTSQSAATPGDEGTSPLRSGQLKLFNIFGTNKSTLSMPIQVQYWSGSSWVLSSDDACTALTADAFNLVSLFTPSSSTTSVTGVSLSGGKGSVTLAVPSQQASGSVSVAVNLGSSGNDNSCLSSHGGTAASLSWLRSRNGSCAATYDRDPWARANFGIYAPETKKTVYIRELF